MITRFKMPSLIIQSLVLTLVLGGIVWVVLDHFQSRDIQTLFFKELSQELDIQAKTNRVLFNQVAEAHVKSAQLIIYQRQFREYVQKGWQTDTFIEHHAQLPAWLPSASLMRQFFPARFAMLLDSKANPREVYFPIAEPLPAALKQANPALIEKSRGQIYMTTLDENPYVLASYTLLDDDGQPLATLLLGSPLDSRFFGGHSNQFKHRWRGHCVNKSSKFNDLGQQQPRRCAGGFNG
jgi:hypothetical protein